MTGTPDEPREVLRLSIASDLSFPAFEEALKLIQEREPDIRGCLTLLCSQSEAGGARLVTWDYEDEDLIPQIVIVPDELLKHPDYWALAGNKTIVIEDRNA